MFFFPLHHPIDLQLLLLLILQLFFYLYLDLDLDVTHDNDSASEHGSHVAGIAAANRFIKEGSGYVSAADAVGTVGNAPDAQILTMKVFGKSKTPSSWAVTR